jgi:hypothetical protein
MRSSEGGGFVLLGPAVPRRCSMRAFCFCLTESIDLTCSMAVGLSRLIVTPITTGEMGVELVCSASSVSSAWGGPLTVTRRFLKGKGVEEGEGGETSSGGE